MLAVAVSSIVLLVRGARAIHLMPQMVPEARNIREVLAFGIPLIPHAFAHWGLAVSDRAVLGAFLPASVVGTYYVAYLAVLPVSLTGIAISQATQPLYPPAAASSAARLRLGRVVAVHFAAVAFVAIAVALLGPPLIVLLLPGEFAQAAAFTPWLAAGAGLFGLYLLPMSVVTLVMGRTNRVWLITSGAAALNVSLNLLLVPQLGAVAAAINTVAGYAVLLAGVTVYATKTLAFAIPVDISRIAVTVTVLAAASAAGFALSPDDPLPALLVRTFVLTMVILPVLLIAPLRRYAIGPLKPAQPRASRSDSPHHSRHSMLQRGAAHWPVAQRADATDGSPRADRARGLWFH